MDSSQDAFVIWLDADLAPGAELRGRVEHVQSAKRTTFASAAELLAFLAVQRAHAGDAAAGSS